MKNDVIKVDKQGTHKLKREGKSYALVRLDNEHLTGCDGCAFQRSAGISACPENSVDGRKTRLICDRIETTRRLRDTTARAVWIQFA